MRFHRVEPHPARHDFGPGWNLAIGRKQASDPALAGLQNPQDNQSFQGIIQPLPVRALDRCRSPSFTINPQTGPPRS
jgi:hypothetical protein